MKTVLVWGTFDVLHLGHINFLEEAKKHGDELIVLLGRDKIVSKIKSKAPIHNEEERLKMISSLKMVDAAFLDREESDFLLVKKIKPDVVCLGYDQVSSFTEGLDKRLKDMGLSTQIVRLEPYKPEKYKSTKIKELLKRN